MGKALRPKREPQGQKKDSGKTVQKSVQIEVFLPFIVSQGNGARGVLHEEFAERICKAVAAEIPDARCTRTGGYYLVDGKVCRVQDFDPETMDRKPGTMPPSYTLAGDEKKAAILAERAAEAASNPPVNALAKQPPNLLTSAETEDVALSRKKLRPNPKPAQEAEPEKKPRPAKTLRRK